MSSVFSRLLMYSVYHIFCIWRQSSSTLISLACVLHWGDFSFCKEACLLWLSLFAVCIMSAVVQGQYQGSFAHSWKNIAKLTLSHLSHVLAVKCLFRKKNLLICYWLLSDTIWIKYLIFLPLPISFQSSTLLF